ncbi:O-Glycosyl hydrolases family 17 protein [Hibiscus syriacus]|uniref:O-Glycosyl hydrolases family 17 protein n=1 Tax=Hibiscus syriacus TaxID=106335 RepID=A0A6A2YTE9_HIBSY|nr:O-Glycosyl hydrolases family 17 protein [Hibiscus syriacus]
MRVEITMVITPGVLFYQSGGLSSSVAVYSFLLFVMVNVVWWMPGLFCRASSINRYLQWKSGKVWSRSFSAEDDPCNSCSELEEDAKPQERSRQEKTLASAVEYSGSPTSNSLSKLPDKVQELLDSIAVLEIIVSKLEQEFLSLQYQLIQERNERRLAEYYLKHYPCPTTSLFDCSLAYLTEPIAKPCNEEETEENLDDIFPSEAAIDDNYSVENLWHHPNQLSEEMVLRIRDIFVFLADSSKHSSSEYMVSPASPHCPLANFLEPFSNSSIVTSLARTSSGGSAYDPYGVFGKVNWKCSIGTYSTAVEVSQLLLVEQLAKVDPLQMSYNEKLAFWINIYHALMMHGNSDRGIHWLKWETVCGPKSHGGLGFFDVSTRNRALLNKWIWRFGAENDSLWKRIISAKYNYTPDALIPKVGNSSKSSWVWRAIVKPLVSNEGNLFSDLKCIMGNGAKIDFWNDHWTANFSLKDTFARVFRLAKKQYGNLTEFGIWENGVWVWRIELRRNLFVWENSLWSNFLLVLNRAVSSHPTLDRLTWGGSNDGRYTPKSYCLKVATVGKVEDSIWKTVWCKFVPPKISGFVWKAVYQRLPVTSELEKRGVRCNDNYNCSFCNTVPETINHVLCHCDGVDFPEV